MPRRHQETELEFGSDSFLDVISNMVGILLILILMAAWRARSQPVEVEEIAKAIHGTVDVETTAPVASMAPQTLPEPSLLPTPNDDLIEQERTQLLRKLAVSQVRVEKLEQELQGLDPQSVGDALSLTKNQKQATTEELRKLNAALAQALADRNQLRSQIQKSNDALVVLKGQLDRINQELQQASAKQTKKEELGHKVMPIGLRRHSQSVLFRVAKGRVSIVPRDELIQQFRERVATRYDWLLKYKHLEGQVGPIDGYIARFSVVYEEFGDRTHGLGWGQAKVDLIAIEPTLRLAEFEEPIEQALGAEGMYRRKLAEMPTDEVVEIWVPSDSFQGYRALLRFGQQQGFHVAGWPLPIGQPYAFGEGGLSSVAQ